MLGEERRSWCRRANVVLNAISSSCIFRAETVASRSCSGACRHPGSHCPIQQLDPEPIDQADKRSAVVVTCIWGRDYLFPWCRWSSGPGVRPDSRRRVCHGLRETAALRRPRRGHSFPGTAGHQDPALAFQPRVALNDSFGNLIRLITQEETRVCPHGTGRMPGRPGTRQPRQHPASTVTHRSITMGTTEEESVDRAEAFA